MYTSRFAGNGFEILNGTAIVLVPPDLEDAFEAHMQHWLPTWKPLTDSAREERVHEACADWLAEHA